MITGRWGKPTEVLLDLVVAPDGAVRGVANPGRENAPIEEGHVDAATGAVHLAGTYAPPDGDPRSFTVDGRLRGRTLHLTYCFGDQKGTIALVRVEEYRPGRITLGDRLRSALAAVRRRLLARTRPRGATNAARLRARGETLATLRARDAVEADIPALAELHVTTWNATYRTSRGPSVETRRRQWEAVFRTEPRRDFVLVLEDRDGRLVGFTWGKPRAGEFAGELSKIYLRWEYHGLGLGRRLMAETARRFLDRGIVSFVLFADLANPTLGFYDRMGGERLHDDRGHFSGAYGWRDVRTLLG